MAKNQWMRKAVSGEQVVRGNHPQETNHGFNKIELLVNMMERVIFKTYNPATIKFQKHNIIQKWNEMVIICLCTGIR
jgi:hypothetical protein